MTESETIFLLRVIFLLSSRSPFSEFAVVATTGGKKFAFTFQGCEFDIVVRRLVKHIQGLANWCGCLNNVSLHMLNQF